MYKNAPIVEAIIDLRFAQSEMIEKGKLLGELKESFSKDYVDIKEISYSELKVGVKDGFVSKNPFSQRGLRFRSNDGKHIFQIKADAFIYSQLAPYQDWDMFLQEIRKNLPIYLKKTSPKNIIRVGLRFINRFDFPGPSIELSDYLNIFPRVPSKLEMRTFGMQAMFAQEDLKSMLIIRQALAPPYKPNGISILLDFDLFSEETRSCSEEIWDFLSQLRERKNEIFENSITDNMREIIK